jgi:hypothetical protein
MENKMKNLSLLTIATLLLTGIVPVLAADWNTELQTAVKTGNFAEIDVIAAEHPDHQGGIAMYLLSQTQENIKSHPDQAIKLFNAAVPFAGQIPLSDAGKAGRTVYLMLVLANDPGFQKGNPNGVNDIYTAALAMSSEPNIVVGNPLLHNAALADANDFMGSNPTIADKKLSDEVDLALQVGSPPPLGPHGVINPSQE